MVLSGHAHIYQRFTRKLTNGKQIPYIVSGSGGFAATAPKPIKAGTTIGDHTLVVAPIVAFGYLTLTCDGKTLSASFKTADGKTVKQQDAVTVDLATGKITAGAGGAGGSKPAKPAKPAKGKAPAKKKAKAKSRR